MKSSRLSVVVAMLLAVAGPAVAQQAIDGDTLKWGALRIRLYGMDAPEMRQPCDGGRWYPGPLARDALVALLARGPVECQPIDHDRYGRTVARCTAGGVDLGAALVRKGLAWAFVRYSRDYVDQEARAKADRLGVHAHGCLPAWEWRAQHR